MIWPTSSGGESQDTPDEAPSSFYNYCGSVCPTQLRSKRKPDSPSPGGARKILVIANPNFSNATSGAAAVVPATIGLSTSGSGSDISAASGHGAGSASTSGSVCDVDSDVGERSAQPSPPTERINVHRTGLMSLPLEVLLIICQHMDVKDLSSLRRASRHLNAIVEVDVLWQRLCQRDFQVFMKLRCPSFALLYEYFSKVHRLALDDESGHLFKETDILWLMARCLSDAPVPRWAMIASSKLKMFGLSGEIVAQHCSGKAVSTGSIGQGGRAIHYYGWRDVVKAGMTYFGGDMEFQKYLIRRSLDLRITSSINERYKCWQTERRQRMLLDYLVSRPDALDTLLSGLYTWGLDRRHDEAPLRNEAVFLIHPLLRLYRDGGVKDGLAPVNCYVRLCAMIQEKIRHARKASVVGCKPSEPFCQREGMDVFDYSNCLHYVFVRLEARLRTGSITFDHMLATAIEFYQRVAQVWQWQTSLGLEYMWRFRPSCVVTGHSACQHYFQTGHIGYLDTMKRDFLAQEYLCSALDNMVQAVKDGIPRSEIEAMYLAVGKIAPPPTGSTLSSCMEEDMKILRGGKAAGCVIHHPCHVSQGLNGITYTAPESAIQILDSRPWARCVPRRYPEREPCYGNQHAASLQPYNIMQHIYKSSAASHSQSLRCLRAEDQDMFHRTVIGWECQNRLQAGQLYLQTFTLVSNFSLTHSAADAEKVLELVRERFHRYFVLDYQRRASAAMEVTRVAERALSILDSRSPSACPVRTCEAAPTGKAPVGVAKETQPVAAATGHGFSYRHPPNCPAPSRLDLGMSGVHARLTSHAYGQRSFSDPDLRSHSSYSEQTTRAMHPLHSSPHTSTVLPDSSTSRSSSHSHTDRAVRTEKLNTAGQTPGGGVRSEQLRSQNHTANITAGMVEAGGDAPVQGNRSDRETRSKLMQPHPVYRIPEDSASCGSFSSPNTRSSSDDSWHSTTANVCSGSRQVVANGKHVHPDCPEKYVSRSSLDPEQHTNPARCIPAESEGAVSSHPPVQTRSAEDGFSEPRRVLGNAKNVGVISNCMIVSTHQHIDRDIHQHFVLHRDAEHA